MYVTPQVSATSGTNGPDLGAPPVDNLFPLPRLRHWYPAPITKTQQVGFCDWLSVYQHHLNQEPLPKLCDGSYIRLDADGAVVNTKLRNISIEGSHDTSVYVRSDGVSVWFEGNVSRFGRPDNVFGYSFSQCINRINSILHDLDLPPFSEGERFITNWKTNPRSIWTGACITRIDMTQNFATGNKEDAYHYMHWLSGQQASRIKTGVYGEGETVDFGRGSRWVYSKAYLKAAEIDRHINKHRSALNKEQIEYLEYLRDWCNSVGLLRFESTYKTTFLHSKNMHYLGGFDMRQLEADFEERKEVLTRGSCECDDLSSLPKHVLGTLRMWQNGDDISSKLPRRTFYRHRKELLKYGFDIAIKSNVVRFPQKTRVIKLGPVSIPEWYELPETIERVRYGNGR